MNGASLEAVGVPWGPGRLSVCVFRVLESDLQCFKRHQAHGLLGKLH
ncbi:unnamed protein product, partial [Gulo gulo]